MTCPRCGAPRDDGAPDEHRCDGREGQQHEHTVVFLVTPGDILDERWRIDRRIGQGAMGSVFAGTDLEKRRPVAIKLLAPEHCRKPKVLARFEREARLMTTLRHPNIVQLHGLGRRGALPYIVMQYLEGRTLSEHLKQKGGRLGAGEMLQVVRQVCSGLAFVHHHGLVHRDIKPQNIFIGPKGRATILDLGVVRDRSDPGLTKPGAMVGTPFYMSPEQILGTAEVDRRTDLYALGAVTFEMLTGHPPFAGDTNFEVLHAHRTRPPPDAADVVAGLPKAVGQVLIRALSKQPDARQQNVHELLTELEVACGPFGRAPVEPAEDHTRPPTTHRSGARPRLGPNPALGAATARGDSVVEVSSVDIVESVELGEGGDDLNTLQLAADPASRADEPRTIDRGSSDHSISRSSSSLTSTGTAESHATVEEHGELRVVTTLRGLTTGAKVFIDAEARGSTPLSTSVTAGVHRVRVEKPAYPTVEREVHVLGNQVTLVRIELARNR